MLEYVMSTVLLTQAHSTVIHYLTGKHLIKGSKGNAKMDLEADFKACFLSTCEVWKPYLTLYMQNHISD